MEKGIVSESELIGNGPAHIAEILNSFLRRVVIIQNLQASRLLKEGI